MITESEFKLGRSCAHKVRHARRNLPRNDTDSADNRNSFARWTDSEAGRIRALARELFPTALNANHSFTRTRELLAKDVVIAGAAFGVPEASCRLDFMERAGSDLRLYSVVSKALDPRRQELGVEFHTQFGNIRGEWRAHLEVMALRTWIVGQLYPAFRVLPSLIVPIRGATTSVEGLHACFEESGGRWRVTDARAAHEAGILLRAVSVAKECHSLVASIPLKIAAIEDGMKREPFLAYKCKNCEFRVQGNESGFDCCWGALSKVKDHMFSLAYMWYIKDENGRPIADTLAREKRASMWDIPEDRIAGDYAARQRLQLEGTRTSREIILPELEQEMAEAAYPLFFLDIETVRSLTPVHRGSTIGGLTLFQWSAHRRRGPGEPLEHFEWLNTDASEPNQRFLAALRETLGETGSILIWTRYEELSFSELLAELIGAGVDGDDVMWLERLLGSGRILDMHDLCFRYYWHPMMGGRTSIKCVLPAVWSEPSAVKTLSPYSAFSSDFYTSLKAKGNGAVSDGCAAMEAYLSLQRSGTKNQTYEALLTYCRYDTLSMALIWDYWSHRLIQTRESAATTADDGKVSHAMPS